MEHKPWLNNYFKDLPHSLKPYPDKTLVDFVADTARQRPDHVAILFKGSSISYSELDSASNAMATALVAQGVKKGDRVAIIMPNTPQFIIAQLAIWKAGAIVAAHNPLYTEKELTHSLNECGSETAIVLTLFYDKLKAIQPQTEIKRIVAANVKEYLSPVLRTLFTLLKEKKEGHRISLKAGDLWFQDLLKQYAGSPRPNVEVTPEDYALILFTGGTTGLSKAAAGTHGGLVATGIQVATWSKIPMPEWKGVFLTALPLFHVFANGGILATNFVNRGCLSLVITPRDLDDLISVIEKTKPIFFPGVPTLFIALLNHPKVKAGTVDMSSLAACISGAAPLMVETKRRFEEVTGGTIVEGYALTESMMAVTANPLKGQGKYKVGSVGMPLPDVEVRIVDEATGKEMLPAGEMGEIVMHAPQIMKGYWGRPTETANTIKDGWLFTGDLGYLDDDGYLFIVDRKKDLIKTSGFQVWPREIEEVISELSQVEEVGVAGVPHEYQGEAVKAWIVLRKGQQISVDEIREHCRTKLAGYKVPKQVEFVDSLPKTTVGKVLRRELVAREKAKMAQSP